ncbi:protein HIRA [Cydia amplana]|uniref:protein HIRA n=1 Tax=Cydia amplana TaxID=1869771 RepID=UPI002FE5DA07
MKLLKPSWVNHDDKPIFSVDIHPTGKRFATGGQGGDSGRVVVWNLNSVLYENVEVDPNIPKMLCQMDNHLACVNCVRWSNAGRYLASGGDDRLVMVWGLSVVANGTPGKLKAETWRCIATLRGHAGDVLDLAWSPLDKWLASCSVDNTIIIWNAEKFPEMVCVLNGHTGLVKGVAWDPVGKYLASQSDDKSLRVWKTADWAQETVITEPFEECGGTTHVLRLSWSPDGQYVLSAHAINGGGPTAQVVERDGWRCDKDFVGHRKAVTCARFNNNIFVKEGKKCCCAAVGARDRALSIWLTSLKRPLVVVHDLFSDSVLDLSWSSDGLNLLACSSDGTVACIQFTNKEIGTPLTLDEKNAFYEKIYGKCPANDSALSNLLVECPEILLAREKPDVCRDSRDASLISEKSQIYPPQVSGQRLRSLNLLVECPEILLAREKPDVCRDSRDASLVSEKSQCPANDSALSNLLVECPEILLAREKPDVCRDSRDASLISEKSQCPANDSALSNLLVECPEILLAREKPDVCRDSRDASLISEKSQGKCPANDSALSNLLVECPEILLAREKPDVCRDSRDASLISEKSQQSKPALTASPVSLRPVDRQIETRTSDGKRRITPVFIPLTMVASESLGSIPTGTENCFSTSSQSKSRIRVERRDDIVIHPNVSNHGSSSQHNKSADNGLDQRLRKRSAPSLPGPKTEEVQVKRSGDGASPPAFHALPAPALGSAGPVVRAAGGLRLQVINKACNTHYGTLSRLQLLPNNSASSDPVWETYLGSPVTCIACDARFAAVSCADGALHAWRLQRSTAHRALPPIALMSPAAKLTLSGDTLAAVTTSAELGIWDLANATCIVRPLSFRSLMQPGVSITNCSLLEDGNPMISLSNGKSYIYCKKLYAWVVWTDARDPVWRACGGLASTRAPRAAHTLYPAQPRPTQANTGSYSSDAARSWLEAQVASCFHLRLAKDYRHWITALFGHLVNHGNEDQLRTILDDMLGPSHCTSTPKKWQATVLGIKKHDILDEMLSLLVRQLRWQRLYSEYIDQLQDIREARERPVLNGH